TGRDCDGSAALNVRNTGNAPSTQHSSERALLGCVGGQIPDPGEHQGMPPVPARPAAIVADIEGIGQTGAQIGSGATVKRFSKRVGAVELKSAGEAFIDLNLHAVIGAGEAVVEVDASGSIDAREERSPAISIAFGRDWLPLRVVSRDVRGGVERAKCDDLSPRLSDVSRAQGIVPAQFLGDSKVPFLHVGGAEAILGNSAPETVDGVDEGKGVRIDESGRRNLAHRAEGIRHEPVHEGAPASDEGRVLLGDSVGIESVVKNAVGAANGRAAIPGHIPGKAETWREVV